MKKSAHTVVVYFLLTLIYKLFSDADNLGHTNIYWLYSSISFSLILNDLRVSAVIKTHKKIFLSASIYWLVMTTLHFVCIFNIGLYVHLNTVNKLTVGAATIFLLLIYLTSSIIKEDVKT